MTASGCSQLTREGVKRADHGLEQIIVTGNGCDPLNWEPWRAINEKVTRVDDRIGAQGYGQRVYEKRGRAPENYHGVSWA
jgi:hypothetical protein